MYTAPSSLVYTSASKPPALALLVSCHLSLPTPRPVRPPTPCTPTPPHPACDCLPVHPVHRGSGAPSSMPPYPLCSCVSAPHCLSLSIRSVRMGFSWTCGLELGVGGRERGGEGGAACLPAPLLMSDSHALEPSASPGTLPSHCLCPTSSLKGAAGSLVWAAPHSDSHSKGDPYISLQGETVSSLPSWKRQNWGQQGFLT